jgi:hypothetical protein
LFFCDGKFTWPYRLFVSTWGRFPKIQLLTVAQLLAGKKIEMPPIKPPEVIYKKTVQVKRAKVKQSELFPAGV